MRGSITADLAVMRELIRKSDKQLYANNFNNLDKMDEFLWRYKLLEFTKKEVSTLNSHTTYLLNILNLYLKTTTKF